MFDIIYSVHTYAALVLLALVARGAEGKHDAIARTAYEIAQAMIDERKRRTMENEK